MVVTTEVVIGWYLVQIMQCTMCDKYSDGNIATKVRNARMFQKVQTFCEHNEQNTTTNALQHTSLFSLYAPSRDAPVYIEQKSKRPSKTGLQRQTKHNYMQINFCNHYVCKHELNAIPREISNKSNMVYLFMKKTRTLITGNKLQQQKKRT